MKPTVLELCAGGGGQAIGFERAGFDHSALIDDNDHACATLRINRPYWNVINADIRQLDMAYWRGVDVVAGGLPCPPFSVAGKQKGRSDERDLFPALLRIVDATNPRMVVVENVRGLMQRRFEQYRADLECALEKSGYRTKWGLLNAFDFGANQNRTRAFMVAHGDDLSFQWPEPNGGGGTVGEALSELIAEGGWLHAKEWAAKADQPAPTLTGGSHKHGGPDLGPTRSRAKWAEIGVDGLGIANEPPSRDFDGMPRLTIKMVACLQSFPPDWQFAGGKTQQYRQIGNALTVELATAVAKAVRKCLKD
ncbi:MAG: DNA (cytosine-5-)-methyltransferase [Chloroflexi bacterium]|nr:DNA (cytosine-5-)-methyltransferase [Chloroflexota bacterium]